MIVSESISLTTFASAGMTTATCELMTDPLPEPPLRDTPCTRLPRGFRLMIFSDTYAPQMNGVTRTLKRLVACVRERGGTVKVVTTSNGRNAPAHDDEGVDRWPSMRFWKYDELRIAPPLVGRARRAMEEFRPHVVHIATPFGVGLAARSAARTLGIPAVSSYHTSFAAYASYYGLGSLTGMATAFLRWFHNGTLRTYSPTRAIANDLVRLGFRNTAVWGRGVDTGLFNPQYRSDELRLRLCARPGDVIVAYVGRLAPEKGLDLAFEAVRQARGRARSRIVLAVAGDGPYGDACRRMAPFDTMFTGRLHGTALSALYASADIFLFPSQTDTFGNVLLEAMASRLAVVAADSPPSRELLEWNGSGAACGVVAEATPDAIAAELVRLADDPELRRALAARGYARARARTWDGAHEPLIAEYALLGGHAPKGQLSEP